jgi:hypothetical protein
MTPRITNPFTLTASEIAVLLKEERPLIPELEAYRSNPAALAALPSMQAVLAQTEPLLAGIENIPQTGYTPYRYFIKNGDRKAFETPYFLKRRAMAALALRVFLGETRWKDLLQDYLWNICEETTWVLPAHELRDPIDLFSAETGFVLATALHLLGRSLDGEIRSRVRTEIEQRIFQRYLTNYLNFHWYKGGNNWNGVCNSSIAATFLLLEPEPDRVAQAMVTAFGSLDYFLKVAFEKDGTSTEGVGYWHYGLMNLIALSEMLRARSAGAIDLLDSEHMRRIAAYPAKLQLSGSMFAAFSDADELIHFNPGIIARLADRTSEHSLYNLLAKPVDFPGDWRMTTMLRNALWWDGTQKDAPAIDDTVLYGGGVARLASPLKCCGQPLLVAIKAGHNNENHNQNDVGSFVVHVDGESLLTDPGRGLYSRFYFGEQRYENIFANSFGHSLPRIGGQLEAPGAADHGELVEVQMGGEHKKAVVEFARAYPLANLSGLRRELRLAATGEQAGTLWLEDRFQFSADPLEVEEAFVTWCDVELNGSSALIRGQRHSLYLHIEQAPEGAHFEVQALEEACQANEKDGVLKRLTIALPAALETTLRVRMEIV